VEEGEKVLLGLEVFPDATTEQPSEER
jgi:hypothetical protein